MYGYKKRTIEGDYYVPLPDEAVSMVVLRHTLEHFEDCVDAFLSSGATFKNEDYELKELLRFENGDFLFVFDYSFEKELKIEIQKGQNNKCMIVCPVEYDYLARSLIDYFVHCAEKIEGYW